MPLFTLNINTSAPDSPIGCMVESSGGSSDDTMPSTPSSHHSSPGAHRSSPGGIDSGGDDLSPRSTGGGGGFNNSRWNNNRYRRSRGRGATPRNQEKRPYHSPNHISPPHDRPMTKNDIYFALDCEVSYQTVAVVEVLLLLQCY